MAAGGKQGEEAHPIEKPMRDSQAPGAGQGHAGETARQSLKHDKDLNRSLPEDQQSVDDQQRTKKETEHGA